jgi:hypothetical protein
VRIIQVATCSWLVLCEAFQPRYLITYGPMIYRPTHETLHVYAIRRHALERHQRSLLECTDTYADAVSWCRLQMETPNMASPLITGQNSAITPEVQRDRWAQGLDPRTGQRRPV